MKYILNIQLFGGRGAISGLSGGSSLQGLLGQGGGIANQQSDQHGSDLMLTANQMQNDYTDNGNPALIKWQGQEESKASRFLAKVDNTTDLATIQASTNDNWQFYDNPQQKLILNMGLNKPATILSEKDFNNYVQQTGATVLYRGWSGQNAIDRFKNSQNSHIGNGRKGDGYYFSSDKGTAMSYGGKGTKAALSPNARVVSLDKVNQAISNSSSEFQSALRKAGSNGTRSYGSNKGQAQMALKMGYNAIDAGWAIVALTRDAIVMSNKNSW